METTVSLPMGGRSQWRFLLLTPASITSARGSGATLHATMEADASSPIIQCPILPPTKFSYPWPKLCWLAPPRHVVRSCIFQLELTDYLFLLMKQIISHFFTPLLSKKAFSFSVGQEYHILWSHNIIFQTFFYSAKKKK